MNEPISNRVSLGASGLQVSPLGVGTNHWGAGRQADASLQPVFEAALNAGINLFDTAEIYNFGGAELTLGRFIPAAWQDVTVTSKFMPLPWRLIRDQLHWALNSSLERLRIKQLDLYLLHFPWGPRKLEAWVESLADVYEAGLVKAVGVSNCTPEQMRRAHAVLSRRGVPLACNQVEYSLLKRTPEQNGLVKLCRELNVTLVAYRPLAGGLLSRKLPEKLPRGVDAQKAQRLLDLAAKFGEAHGGKSTGQVALNWLMCRGALPIPGATKVEHIGENTGALGWKLSEEEVKALDEAGA